ncbi:MAG: sigma-70 family RNA polymerase sigma factor [Polyangiales bacterium]
MNRETQARRATFEREALPLMDGLYGAAVRLTGRADTAEDLVQETLLAAYQNWERFEPGTNLRAWLHRIQVNRYISQWRTRKRERAALDIERDPGKRAMLLTSAQEAMESDDGGVQRRTLGPALSHALDALPVEFRAVVVMADLCDMSYREIADAMRCPIGTVMSRLHRGRRALAKTLRPELVAGEVVEAEAASQAA